ncbi:MAG: RCC1 domain-containing protein, partial [Clostridia bacterium]|nr:RCC1 domain-containing protein [Clostridia bacterium]
MKQQLTARRVLGAVLAVMLLVVSVAVLPRQTPVKAFETEPMVAAGIEHRVELKSDGTVWTWGSNNWGQLGDGTTSAQQYPVQVAGVSDVTAVAAGGEHTVVLKNDGT